MTMSRGALLLSLLAAFAALAQISAVPQLFADGRAAPLLPVALFAAWASVRGIGEVVPGVLLAAATLGVASEERVGAFLLALLPAAALAAALSGVLSGIRAPLGAHGHSPPGAPGQTVIALAAAAGGSAAYVAILTATAGVPAALPAAAGPLAIGALWTAVLAGVLSAPLRLSRRQRAGLFE